MLAILLIKYVMFIVCLYFDSNNNFSETVIKMLDALIDSIFMIFVDHKYLVLEKR